MEVLGERLREASTTRPMTDSLYPISLCIPSIYLRLISHLIFSFLLFVFHDNVLQYVVVQIFIPNIDFAHQAKLEDHLE